MKVVISRQTLLAALQTVGMACAQRTTKPVLANVKAVAEDDRLTLTAFDTEVGCVLNVRGVDVLRAGSSILPVKELTRILQEGRADAVVLDADADGVRATADKSKFDLRTYPVDEFPDLPAFDDGGRYHEVTAGDIAVAIKRTQFAADKKDSGGRFALTGVLWEAEGKVCRLVATDTKRLALCEVPATLHGPAEGGVKVTHLIPSKAITLLDRTLDDPGELVRVALRPNEAMFQTGRAMVYTRLVEGRYPPYREVLAQAKKAATVRVDLTAYDFLSHVKQSAILTDDESKRVDMTFGGGAVRMETRGSAAGSSEVVMDLPGYSGDEVKIAFDPVYVIEFLRVLEDDAAVTLEMSDGSKSAVFGCGESYRYLVMPLADR